MKGIEVTVKDLDEGSEQSVVIKDDYVLITAGRCYLEHTQAFPSTGTHILTVKKGDACPLEESSSLSIMTRDSGMRRDVGIAKRRKRA